MYEVVFQLSWEDIAALQADPVAVERTRRKRGPRAANFPWWFILLAVVVILLSLAQRGKAVDWEDTVGSVFPFVLGFGLLIVFLVVVNRGAARRAVKAQFKSGTLDNLLREQTIRIDAEGLTISDRYSRTTTRWAGVQEVLVGSQFGYLYIGENVAHAIPKRAFSNQEEFAAFFRAAELFREQAAAEAADLETRIQAKDQPQ